jgi:hypothetical protein
MQQKLIPNGVRDLYHAAVQVITRSPALAERRGDLTAKLIPSHARDLYHS